MTLLPDERLVALRPGILAAVRDAAREVCGEPFGEFFDASLRSLLIHAFERAGAHEGSVWLLDETRSVLIPRFNSGPNAERFVGTFRQSVRSGMIGMVAATEQSICENEISKNAHHDRTLDQRLQLDTWAMLAVPFYFFGELRGVISCVQLKPADSAETSAHGFSSDDLQCLELIAGVLSHLIEYRLLTLCIGLD